VLLLLLLLLIMMMMMMMTMMPGLPLCTHARVRTRDTTLTRTYLYLQPC
jgi:hypothetical protein